MNSLSVCLCPLPFLSEERRKEEEQRERAAKPRHKPKKEERQVAGSGRSAYQVAEKEVVLRYIKSNRFVQKRNRKIIESPSPLRGSQMHFAGIRRVARHGRGG